MSDVAALHAKDKPYVFAILTVVVAVAVTAIMFIWGGASPEAVLIGLDGRHDGPANGDRLAACLDCHVPFVGTPGSRCLGPGCHGELATGTPPREGPAMPIRFHAVLRERPCATCHEEHVRAGTLTATRTFTHELIPADTRGRCNRCHTASGVAAHARADSLECSLCHDTFGWDGVDIEHRKVEREACDLCHAAPEKETHQSVAGSCSECHQSTTWTPIEIKPAGEPVK